MGVLSRDSNSNWAILKKNLKKYTDFLQIRIRYNYSGSNLAKKFRLRPDPNLQDKHDTGLRTSFTDPSVADP